MKIIDKNQDCYDYLSNIYGIDNKVIYDRRGSLIIKNQQNLFESIYPKREYSYLYSYSFNTYFILEVGFYQYLFAFKNPEIHDYTIYTYDSFTIIHIFNDNKHYFEKPMTICKIKLTNQPYFWKTRKEERIVINSFTENIDILDFKIENPIIKNTEITKFISIEDIWKNLCNYISSLDNDKNIDIINSDVDKAINHGFDKRWSFRHPIK